MQLKLDFLPGFLAIFFEVMTPLLKAVVSWWIHCCVFLFALVIMQDFSTLWALGCSLSADSCARALGPSDKLVGYWSNSSSSFDIAIPFFSFTVLFLQCHCVLDEPLVSLVAMVLLFCVILLLSSFSLCYCVIFFFGAAPGYHVLSDILTWVPTLGVLLCFEVDLLLVLCCTNTCVVPILVLYQYLCCTNIFLGLLIFFRLLLSYYWVFWNL